MESMKETRPFNLEHAKAGAPFACKGGAAVQILKWDRKAVLPIIGIIDDMDQTVMGWDYEGRNGNESNTHLVMTHLGYIDDKPVFVGDTIIYASGIEDVVEHHERDFTGCRWPAPAKVYPETLMTDLELFTTYNAVDSSTKPLRRIANAALRHAIDAGQVIALDQHVRECGEAHVQGINDAQADRDARDMAIAEAVHQAAFEAVRSSDVAPPYMALNKLHLAAIIAKVPA